MRRSSLRGRIAVSPKIVRMLSTPMPRTSRKSLSTSGTGLDGVRGDAIELDDVVGDEAVAARDELERQLALADRRCPGDQHAELQHVQEHAVQRRRLGEHAREVVAEDVDQVRRRLRRGKQRDVRGVAALDEVGRRRLAVRDAARSARPRRADRSRHGPRPRQARKVGDLGRAEDLDAERVMKFMWPTCPMVGFSSVSPVSTRLPPWRPRAR